MCDRPPKARPGYHDSGVRALLTLAVASMLGCSSGGRVASAADAGVDAGAALPGPRMPPARPVLAPCPTGWREVPAMDDPTTCDPWPDSGPADCASIDEAHFPGTPGCSRIGTACPSGDFPEGLPAGSPVRYVLAGTAPGGDGSLARPFATIGAAFATIAAGTIVAVGRGDYDEAFNVPGGVTVWGACVAETRLHVSTPSVIPTSPVVAFTHTGSVLRNVSIGPGPRQAVFVDGRLADATLDSVVVHGGALIGIAANGGHLVMRDVVVRDMGGRGFELVQGATVEATRLVVERVHQIGIFSTLDATTRLEDTSIRAVLADADGNAGMGVNLQHGAALDASRFVVEDVYDGGILVLSAGLLTLTDAVIRDVRQRVNDGTFGTGVSIESGSTATLTRVLVERATETGVTVALAGSSATVTDVVVRDILGHPGTGAFGRGFVIQTGARLALERGWVARAREIALFVAGADAHGSFTDVTVRDTAANGDGAGGRALSVQEAGAGAEVVRGDFARSHEIGIATHEGTTLRLTDVAVRDTASRVSDSMIGDGLSCDGGDVEGTRVLLDGNRRAGVLARGGARLRLSALTVRATMPQQCATTTCSGEGFGVGVVAVGGGRLSATDFAVVGAALCGALVADGSSEVDLSHGQVRGCEIGACIQSGGYDVSRLSLDVLYADNGRNLDTTSLPVPTAVPPL